MTTENKRDLAADLAICGAATEYVNMCVGETEVFCDYMDPELPHGFHVAEFVRIKDAEFFVEAREGWPEAIRRATAAEAEVARLEAFLRSESELAIGVIERMEAAEKENAILIEALRGIIGAIERGALVKQKMSAALDYDIRRAKEALSNGEKSTQENNGR